MQDRMDAGKLSSNINSMVVKFDNEMNVTFPKINCILHFVDTLPKLAIGITIFNKAKERKVPRTNRPIISLHKLLAVRSVLEGTIRRGIPGLSATLNLDNTFCCSERWMLQKTNLCRISFVLKVNDFVMLDLTKKPPKICSVPAKDKENL